MSHSSLITFIVITVRHKFILLSTLCPFVVISPSTLCYLDICPIQPFAPFDVLSVDVSFHQHFYFEVGCPRNFVGAEFPSFELPSELALNVSDTVADVVMSSM